METLIKAGMLFIALALSLAVITNVAFEIRDAHRKTYGAWFMLVSASWVLVWYVFNS